VTIDSGSGVLTIETADDFEGRRPAELKLDQSHVGMGRELFAAFRHSVNDAESGASIFGEGDDGRN